MSAQKRIVNIALPDLLSMYERPLFLHAMSIILPGIQLGVSFQETTDSAEILTAEIPIERPIFGRDVVGAARAALRSIGLSGEVKEFTDNTD